jgi:hypothetical protein
VDYEAFQPKTVPGRHPPPSATFSDSFIDVLRNALKSGGEWSDGLALIHEWAEDLEVVGTDFHPAFRELLALDSYKWEEEDVPPRPLTPAPQ